MELALPLQGIKVVELATVVAAPAATRLMASYGADVIKVETLFGDAIRQKGHLALTPCEDYKNPLFTLTNSNKRLSAIDIKSAEGREALLKLIDQADIFVTNVREPSLMRLGLDYESLKVKYPRLIYALFSGYGTKGPDAADPGFDSTAFWLRNGAIADWQVKGAYPFLPTYAFGDLATSSVLLSGILMALRALDQTGHGTKVETSLMANGIWCNSIGVMSTQFERKCINPDPDHPRDPFFNYYQCSDGKWIGVFSNDYVRELPKFAKAFYMEDIVDDPRYATLENIAETGVIGEAIARIAETVSKQDSRTWRAHLIASNVACEIMQPMCEVSADEQAIANGFIEPIEYYDGSTMMIPCPPLTFSDYGRRPYETAAPVGRDNDEIFRELGYTQAQIDDLRSRNVIR